MWIKPDRARPAYLGKNTPREQAAEDLQLEETKFWIGKVREGVRLTLEDLEHIAWREGRFMPVMFDLPGPGGEIVENTRGAVVKVSPGVFGVSKTKEPNFPGICPHFKNVANQTVTGDEEVWEKLNVTALVR